MKILSVIPLQSGILKENLTYFTNADIPIGNIVSVPVRNKKTLALVIGSENLHEQKTSVKELNFSLKKAEENKGRSVFLPEFLDAAFNTAKYFAQNQGSIANSLIPNALLEEYDKIKNIKNGGKNLSEKNSENKQNLKAEKLLFQYPFLDRISAYKTLIRESFARGKSIFIILPTESDINKFGGQLSKGIEQFVFTFHSRMSAKKILLMYEQTIISEHPVLIIGTPLFLSVPRQDIGTIILEHESSGAYQTIRRPHLDLRIFAEVFASKLNAKFILADELLRFETVGRKDTENLSWLYPLSFRIDFSGTIKISGRESAQEKKFQIFTEESLEEIKLALREKKNIFIFSLRKGLATETLCRDCGENVSCKKCEAPLTLYLSAQGDKRMFVCNRCAEEKEAETVCAHCGSWNLIPLGIGTDTVYEEIKKLFPKTKILKMDKEAVKTAKGAEKISREFSENAGTILIGTEMAFFYLKNKVPLSIVASFDSLWSLPNFKMSEKIIQIALSMIGYTSEKLIIQTRNKNDAIIRAVQSENFLPFVREELEERKKFGYPPYQRFIKITYLGNKEETLEARKILEAIFKEYDPEIFSGFVARLKGKYVTNALIKINPARWSLSALVHNSMIDENLLAKLFSLPPNFEIFVDPEDLL